MAVEKPKIKAKGILREKRGVSTPAGTKYSYLVEHENAFVAYSTFTSYPVVVGVEYTWEVELRLDYQYGGLRVEFAAPPA